LRGARTLVQSEKARDRKDGERRTLDIRAAHDAQRDAGIVLYFSVSSECQQFKRQIYLGAGRVFAVPAVAGQHE